MTLAYSDVELMPNTEFNLNPARDRLLMPSTVTGDRFLYSGIEGFYERLLKCKT